MFGIGLPELLVIMAVALIVVGPDKLPGLARSVAKTLMELKQTAEEVKNSFHEETNSLSDIKPELEDAAKRLRETIEPQADLWHDDSTTGRKYQINSSLQSAPTNDDNRAQTSDKQGHPASPAAADTSIEEEYGQEEKSDNA